MFVENQRRSPARVSRTRGDATGAAKRRPTSAPEPAGSVSPPVRDEEQEETWCRVNISAAYTILA